MLQSHRLELFPAAVVLQGGCHVPQEAKDSKGTHTSLPASTSCLLPFWVRAQSEAPCLSMRACCHACLTSCTWEWTILVLWGSCLEDQPALLGPSALQGSFLWGTEQAKICPSEVQVCNSVVHLAPSSHDLKLYSHLVAAAKAASSFTFKSSLVHGKWATKSTLMFNSPENTCLLISKMR